MELSDLSAEQQNMRATVTEALTGAGWEPSAIHEMADEGGDVNFVASLEYDEGDLGLTVDYEPEGERLHVTIGSVWGDNTVVTVPADGRVAECLRVVTSCQDTISDETLDDLVGELRSIYPEAQVAQDGSDD